MLGLQPPHSQMMNAYKNLFCFNRNLVLKQNKILRLICMTPTKSFNKLPKQCAKTGVKEWFQEDRHFLKEINDFLQKEVIFSMFFKCVVWISYLDSIGPYFILLRNLVTSNEFKCPENGKNSPITFWLRLLFLKLCLMCHT